MAHKNNTEETLESLGALKYKELQALAKKHGIKANLSKDKLIQELLSPSTQQQTNTTGTPADLDIGDDTDGADDVGGADGGDKSQEEPQDGALRNGDDVDGDDDGRDGDAHDKPQDKSQDKSQDEPQDGAQQPQYASSEPQHDRKGPIGVCDIPQDESFHSEDAVLADQNADSTLLSGPTETEQQEQQHEEEQQQQEKEQQQNDRQQQQQQEEEQVASEGSERRRSERLVVSNQQEKKIVTVAPRKIQSPKFVTKRPAACPSSRFDLVHQNMFALQPSIERYGKTPKKAAAQTDASKGKVPAGRQTVAKAKTPASKANAPAGTPARPLEAVLGSGLKSVKRGLTVASKPCTLVVQRSSKKPTQVKEFRLGSNREVHKFKPYSGPVRPMTPGALADKTSSFNVGSSGTSGHGLHNSSKKASFPLQPAWIKAKLASGTAQAARRSAKIQSSKVHREKKFAEGRAGRA